MNRRERPEGEIKEWSEKGRKGMGEDGNREKGGKEEGEEIQTRKGKGIDRKRRSEET